MCSLCCQTRWSKVLPSAATLNDFLRRMLACNNIRVTPRSGNESNWRCCDVIWREQHNQQLYIISYDSSYKSVGNTAKIYVRAPCNFTFSRFLSFITHSTILCQNKVYEKCQEPWSTLLYDWGAFQKWTVAPWCFIDESGATHILNSS